jgi:hypothetical protein
MFFKKCGGNVMFALSPRIYCKFRISRNQKAVIFFRLTFLAGTVIVFRSLVLPSFQKKLLRKKKSIDFLDLNLILLVNRNQ